MELIEYMYHALMKQSEPGYFSRMISKKDKQQLTSFQMENGIAHIRGQGHKDIVW